MIKTIKLKELERPKYRVAGKDYSKIQYCLSIKIRRKEEYSDSDLGMIGYIDTGAAISVLLLSKRLGQKHKLKTVKIDPVPHEWENMMAINRDRLDGEFHFIEIRNPDDKEGEYLKLPVLVVEFESKDKVETVVEDQNKKQMRDLLDELQQKLFLGSVGFLEDRDLVLFSSTMNSSMMYLVKEQSP